MDISHTLAPNSDQLDAVDLLSGPQTFTIERVSKGDAEQPVQIHLADFPRPWRPGKSMRRVLVACWGPDAAQYVGRRVELFCDSSVVFGGQAVGGTRISRLSDIDGAKKVPLLVSRGKSAIFVVQPLPDAPAPVDTTEMFVLLGKTGRGDKDAALGYISGKLGRDVKATKELSADDVAKVVAALGSDVAEPEPTLDLPDPEPAA